MIWIVWVLNIVVDVDGISEGGVRVSSRRNLKNISKFLADASMSPCRTYCVMCVSSIVKIHSYRPQSVEKRYRR